MVKTTPVQALQITHLFELGMGADPESESSERTVRSIITGDVLQV